MWIKQLGELYSESWGPSSPNKPGRVHGTLAPKETHDSVRMKGVFGAGGHPPNPLAVSQASGQNPFEQEEDQMISKNTVLKLIETHIGHLDSKNHLDQSGVLHLGKLKKDIKGL